MSKSYKGGFLKRVGTLISELSQAGFLTCVLSMLTLGMAVNQYLKGNHSGAVPWLLAGVAGTFITACQSFRFGRVPLKRRGSTSRGTGDLSSARHHVPPGTTPGGLDPAMESHIVRRYGGHGNFE